MSKSPAISFIDAAKVAGVSIELLRRGVWMTTQVYVKGIISEVTDTFTGTRPKSCKTSPTLKTPASAGI